MDLMELSTLPYVTHRYSHSRYMFGLEKRYCSCDNREWKTTPNLEIMFRRELQSGTMLNVNELYPDYIESDKIKCQSYVTMWRI
jgi:hypothetical protein